MRKCVILILFFSLGASFAQQQQPANPPADSTHLVLVKGQKARYPEEAKASGIQGEVLVDVLIDEEGKVTQAKAVSGDDRLTNAAVEAVRTWEFQPWIKNGHAVRVHTKVPVDFAFTGNVVEKPQPGVLMTSPPAGSAERPQRVRVSQGVSQGLLVRQVKPVYPREAREAGIQGSVIIQAVIGKDGMLLETKVISGPKELQQAAVGAVQQWRYKPYYLNGKPVEVETQITVNFQLR